MVLNFGVSGYGTEQEFIKYKTTPLARHSAHVFYVLCGNDLENISNNNLFTIHNGKFFINEKDTLVQLWRIMKDPAIDRAVIYRESTFLHQFFDVPITKSIREIPTNALEDHVVLKMSAFEGYRWHIRSPLKRPHATTSSYLRQNRLIETITNALKSASANI